MPSSIRCHQRREVDQIEKRGLQQLHNCQGTFNAQQRVPRKHHSPLLYAPDSDFSSVQPPEVVEKILLCVFELSLDVRDLLVSEVEGVDETQALLYAGKDGKLSVKWALPEVQIEARLLLVLPCLPVGVHHRQLVQIRQCALCSLRERKADGIVQLGDLGGLLPHKRGGAHLAPIHQLGHPLGVNLVHHSFFLCWLVCLSVWVLESWSFVAVLGSSQAKAKLFQTTKKN
mmetsp:Transcript_27635/g.54216  ORF Transcript_27635/g.54216 Transcript_27635/m.54216 type:complete len:229 (-) Transcript_27635:183-869(-)